MMTSSEARRRAEHYNGRIARCGADLDYRVTLNEWRRDEAEAKAYYTDDLEDAVLTLAAMRRQQDAGKVHK